MIKKITITGIWIGEEKELTAKKGKNAGNKFKVCTVGLFTPDTDKEYGGKFLSGSMAKSKAETLKEEINLSKDLGGKEMELNITLSETLNKDGEPFINWRFPTEEMRKDEEIAKLKADLAKANKKTK